MSLIYRYWIHHFICGREYGTSIGYIPLSVKPNLKKTHELEVEANHAQMSHDRNDRSIDLNAEFGGTNDKWLFHLHHLARKLG